MAGATNGKSSLFSLKEESGEKKRATHGEEIIKRFLKRKEKLNVVVAVDESCCLILARELKKSG